MFVGARECVVMQGSCTYQVWSIWSCDVYVDVPIGCYVGEDDDGSVGLVMGRRECCWVGEGGVRSARVVVYQQPHTHKHTNILTNTHT